MPKLKRGAAPVYGPMQEEISRRIRDGELNEEDALPSENDLAAQFKISRGSVRTALTELAQTGMVYTLPGKGWYVKKPGRIASASERGRIAFIAPGLEDSDFQIYQGVEDVLNKRGYILSIFNSQRDAVQENKNIRLLLEGKEKGAIIFPNWGRANAEIVFELKRANYPFVLIDRYYRDLDTNYVITDNKAGGFMATEHLIKLGHRRIGIILGVSCTAMDDRMEGYREALAKHGIACDLSLIIRMDHSDGVEPSEGGCQEARKLLKERPTAIFATNDFLAQGCYRAAKEAGIAIPNDLSIVGFDNQRFSEYLLPPLTTIAQPFYQIGQRAVEILLNKIDGNKETQHVVLAPEFVARESTMQLASNHVEAGRYELSSDSI